MFEDRRKRSTFLIATYCEHCGRSTRVTDKGRKEVLEAISVEKGSIPRDCIKNALKRLEMYPKERNGKNSKIKQSKRKKASKLS